MKKFVFVYYNGGDPAETSKEEMDQIMADWGKWFEELGDKLVDGGNPFNDNGMVVSNKIEVNPIPEDKMPSSGYTIVNAESMEEAVEIAKSNPMHKHTDGKAAIRVYEAMPM